MIVTLEKKGSIIFGGHPAITPMISKIIEQSQEDCRKHFKLYQSRYFQEFFLDELNIFADVIITPLYEGPFTEDVREKSLTIMREQMLDNEFSCGIFIGGMEGVEAEYSLFRHAHPEVPAWAISSTGAAANILLEKPPEKEFWLNSKLIEMLRFDKSYIYVMRTILYLSNRELSHNNS